MYRIYKPSCTSQEKKLRSRTPWSYRKLIIEHLKASFLNYYAHKGLKGQQQNRVLIMVAIDLSKEKDEENMMFQSEIFALKKRCDHKK